jgi:hypothetical protein
MDKRKRFGRDRDNKRKRSSIGTRGKLGHVTPLQMTGTTPQSQPKVDVDMAASEEAASPVTQSAAALDGAATQNNVNASAAGSPGEILENTEATSVDAYAANISAAWHRTVNAVMSTAQFCAQADARLSSEQKKELIGKLPFGEETFSKLVGIGNDLRLQQPEIQRQLPPYYTTIYLITTLDEDEFRLAVDLQVIHAEVTRSELEQWRKDQRREVKGQQVAARTPESNTAEADTAPQEPTKDIAAPEPGVQGEVLAPAVEVLSPAISPEPIPAAAGDVTIPSPSVAPMGDENITSVSDGSSLSADDQAVLDLLNATWDRASDLVRAQFRARIDAR